MKIIQTKTPDNYAPVKDPDAIDVKITTNPSGAFLNVYFGANVTRASMYVLGYESGKPVLVPVEQGGYKVNNRNIGQSATMRFKLTDGAIKIFGADNAAKINENIEWEFELCRRIENHENYDDMSDNSPNENLEFCGIIDEQKRVWIEIK